MYEKWEIVEEYIKTKEGLAFYELGVSVAEMNQSLVMMGEAINAGYASVVDLEGALADLSWRQRLAIWIIEVAGRIVD